MRRAVLRFSGRLSLAAIASLGLFGAGTLPSSNASGNVPTLASPTVALANAASVTEPPFWITNPDGHVIAFSGAGDFGSLKGTALNKPIVGMSPTPDNGGYYLVATDGGVFSFGNAGFYGSTGSIKLNKPIVAMTPTPTNKGYWMVASDGGIFAFGDAQFYGSTGSLSLNKPIVAMAATPTNKGYWLIASDGGIFAFGDAAFWGSTGSLKLVSPIVSMASTPTNKGYWLLAADGGVFSFGDAGFYGSGGGGTDKTYEKIVATPDGKGYWIVRNGGDTLSFGSAAVAASRTGASTRPAVALMYTTTTPGDVAVDYALRRMDIPYLWGGNGPNGYDCSGLTSQAWKAAGQSINRVANDQYNNGRHIDLSELRPGDLLFYGNDLSNSRSIDHVAMYVGGGWAVNAGGTSKPSRVSIRSVPQTAYGRLFTQAVRLVG